MKGNNELVLNRATIIEALQEWIDKRMPDYAPEITDIKYNCVNYNFIVKTKEKEEIA